MNTIRLFYLFTFFHSAFSQLGLKAELNELVRALNTIIYRKEKRHALLT